MGNYQRLLVNEGEMDPMLCPIATNLILALHLTYSAFIHIWLSLPSVIDRDSFILFFLAKSSAIKD
jgi:hypothetical protein